MYTVQPKQYSWLSKYMNILERYFYVAVQKLSQLREKLNHLHKINTQTTLMSEYSLKI